MSPEDRALASFERLLAAVGERADEIEPRPIASMWPHTGSAYRPGGVFILGQALDGWDPAECSARWRATEARSAEGRVGIIEGTRAWHADEPEPIAPVLEVGKRRGSTYWLFGRRTAPLDLVARPVRRLHVVAGHRLRRQREAKCLGHQPLRVVGDRVVGAADDVARPELGQDVGVQRQQVGNAVGAQAEAVSGHGD